MSAHKILDRVGLVRTNGVLVAKCWLEKLIVAIERTPSADSAKYYVRRQRLMNVCRSKL